MNFIIFISSLTLLFYFTFLTLLFESDGSIPDPIPWCKRNQISINFTNKTDVDDSALLYIKKLWSTPYPVLSEKGKYLKRAILYMAESDVERWRNIAMMVTAWIWTALPQYKCKPNFCAFTQIINASMDCDDDGEIDCEALKIGTNSLSQTLMDATSYSTATTLSNAGCTFKKPKSTMPKCWKYGSVYPARDFWNKHGHDFPCIYQKAVLTLYYSNTYDNELMAAVATACATKYLSSFHTSFNFTLMYQVFHLQTTTGRIDRSHCDYLKADLAETMSFAKEASDLSALQILKDAGCYK